MASGRQAPFSPAVAQAIAQAGVPAALQSGKDPVTFTRAALLEFALACWASAETGAQTRPGVTAAWPQANVLGANEQWAFDTAKLDGINLQADVTKGVPPDVAVAIHYLATRRALRQLKGAARVAPSQVPMVSHEAVSTGPEGGTINIPGMGPIPVPFPMPTGFPTGVPAGSPIPGFPTNALQGVFDDGVPTGYTDRFGRDVGLGAVDLGAIPAAVVVLCLGAAAIAAGAWAIETIETEKEVQATKRRELEVVAQVKLATDLCAVNAAAGQPCDVPSVVGNLAKDEKRDRWLVPALVIGGIAAVGGGAVLAHRKGLL